MASLKRAAEELVNAAIEETKTSSLATSQETLAELRHIHGIVDKLHHVFSLENDHSEKRHQAIVNALPDNEPLLSEFSKLNKTLLHGFRMQRLQWGIDHVQHGSFNYKPDPSSYHSTASSKEIVSTILLNFMQGSGVFICGFSLQTPVDYQQSAASKVASAAAFHRELIDQISKLIGETATVNQHADGRYAIALPTL